MALAVRFDNACEMEFSRLHPDVQDALLAYARLLEEYGPLLGRPHVDTLKGSVFPNTKELRFKAADGIWRAAFAFDPAREAYLAGARR